MNTAALILAAGKGERMRSALHKALHTLCGRPMIDYVLDAVTPWISERPLVAVCAEKEQVIEYLGNRAVFVHQDPARDGWGTAAPVKCARDALAAADQVLIAFCDMPLVRPESYRRVLDAVENGADCAFMTAVVENPFRCGRILRDGSGQVTAIVEEKDCTEAQRQIHEVNTSVYCFKTDKLLQAVQEIGNHNAKNEYYLTDAIGLFVKHGWRVEGIVMDDSQEGQGVNDLADLAVAERTLRRRINTRHMQNGVRLVDPEATYIDETVRLAPGVTVHPGCVLQGQTVVEAGAVLLPNCRLQNAHIGPDAQVESSVVLDASVGAHTTVGPNAYLRPGSQIGAHCRIGDFVEIKNANIGDGTKVSHLTYVGDADLGKDINLGCGVVFVNYDGKNKYRSTVEDHAFIGCNCNLVAPVHVGEGAYIAAGSTITKDVEAGSLCIARSRQSTIHGWAEQRRRDGRLK